MATSRHRGLAAALATGASLWLLGCTSGGGPASPPATPGQFQLGAATTSVAEGAGVVHLTVTRTDGSDGVVTVQLATSDGSAVAPGDYAAVATTVVFAAGDAAPKSIDVTIVNDTAFEPTEGFTVTLSAATGGAALGTPSSATVTIQDDDPAPPAPGFALDDTGVTTCATASANGLPCADATAGTADLPRQDAEQGRDLTTGDGRDGRAGFSFRKLAATGTPLLDQSIAYATTPWACLVDLVTGLTWEVATDDGGPRDRRWRYSWYDSTGLGPYGAHGVPGAGTCAVALACDTEKHAAAARADRLCGFSDWRVPTRAELHSLVDYGAPAPPLVDGAFLPDAAAEAYWTASADWSGRAWTVDFLAGGSRAEWPATPHPVRLVRGGY